MYALRSAKRQFLQNLLSSVCNPRQFWSAYYSLRPNRLRIPVHLTNGSVTVESACNECDLLNSHLVSIFSDPIVTPLYLPQLLMPPAIPLFAAPARTSIVYLLHCLRRQPLVPMEYQARCSNILLVLLRHNYQHFSISRCPLVLSLLTGSYLMSPLSTRLENLNWSQTTVQSLSCHFHRSSLSVCICNSMGVSEIWDKYHEYCSENGEITRGEAECNLPFSLQYEWYLSQISLTPMLSQINTIHSVCFQSTNQYYNNT